MQTGPAFDPETLKLRVRLKAIQACITGRAIGAHIASVIDEPSPVPGKHPDGTGLTHVGPSLDTDTVAFLAATCRTLHGTPLRRRFLFTRQGRRSVEGYCNRALRVRALYRRSWMAVQRA